MEEPELHGADLRRPRRVADGDRVRQVPCIYIYIYIYIYVYTHIHTASLAQGHSKMRLATERRQPSQPIADGGPSATTSKGHDLQRHVAGGCRATGGDSASQQKDRVGGRHAAGH